MSTLFLICAITGGTLLLLQFLAGVLGFGGEESGDVDSDVSGDGGHGHDLADGDHGGSSALSTYLFGVLSFKSIMTAITFFGIGGMASLGFQLDDFQAFGIALLTGIVALYAIGLLMRLLYNLKADGTIRIDRALGKTGTVYLKIPGHRSGTGKVTLNLNNRSVEYLAITADADLPTGSKIVVVAIHRPDTLEVALASSPIEPTSSEKPSHV